MLSFGQVARFAMEQCFSLAHFFVAALFIGIAANVMQVGFLVSGEAIKPQ